MSCIPRDLAKRAIINQRLFFDASVIYASIANVSGPFWINGVTEVPQEKLDAIHRGLKLLETFLGNSPYLAGDSLTLADLSTGPTVSALPAAVDIDPATYPKVTAWLDRLNQLPYYKEINEAPAQSYVAFLRSKWTKLGDKLQSLRKSRQTDPEDSSEDFLKKNPQHTVPVLDDNGTLLWDSHAIAAYLVDKYAKSDELYPKDLVKRAIINQRLFFEASAIFPGLINVVGPFWTTGCTVVPQEKLDSIHRGLKILETFLSSSSYLVGDSLTLADLLSGPTVSALRAAVDIEPVEYPKVCAWLDRLNQIPYYKAINEGPVQGYVAFLRSKWTKLGA
ncbi:GM21874 [Drosophila sechellia]|uniref:GM21874 n=1 Tax=Drosophila sechellia TaxID=7238 RepID=B4HNN0_DROSE|nr:GM21874 [Drosophila sechellia]